MAALKPRVALLSAGPTTRVSDEVLRRYQDVGAALYRTDVHGAITLDTDGRVTVTLPATAVSRVLTQRSRAALEAIGASLPRARRRRTGIRSLL